MKSIKRNNNAATIFNTLINRDIISLINSQAAVFPQNENKLSG